MVVEGTLPILITFILAMIGYVGLTAVVLMSLFDRLPLRLWRIIAAIIAVHVVMVWHFRYQWDFSLSVRNGYAGFAIFHGALLMIVASVFSRLEVAKWLIRIAFLIVTAGAIGAVFRYDAVENYRYPVIGSAAAGLGGMIGRLFQARRAR